ncbi:MAG: hypothetical protein ABMB14_28395 [Myxococcota bacterium]
MNVGSVVGAVVAPLFAAGSAARDARLFHPVGVVHRASVAPIASATDGDHPVGRRLAGAAIVRFSGAIWRRDRSPDILGMAIRFKNDRPMTIEVADEDQDLALATMASVFLLPVALLTTRSHDYLANRYTGAGWFEVDGLGRVRLLVDAIRRPPARTRPSPGTPDRDERLDRAVTDHEAVLRLSAIRIDSSGRTAIPVATITLGPRWVVDQQALRFDPFRDGLGIRPVGLIQAIRRPVYAASQRARGAG